MTPMPIRAQDGPDEPVTSDVLAKALERGRARGADGPLRAVSVHYVPALHALAIGFADRCGVTLDVASFPELASLDRRELEALTIGFGGRALCLEAQDLDVSIEGLIAASASLRAMAHRVVAVHNGQQRSPAKAQAARENGRKGGRPPAHAGSTVPWNPPETRAGTCIYPASLVGAVLVTSDPTTKLVEGEHVPWWACSAFKGSSLHAPYFHYAPHLHQAATPINMFEPPVREISLGELRPIRMIDAGARLPVAGRADVMVGPLVRSPVPVQAATPIKPAKPAGRGAKR